MARSLLLQHGGHGAGPGSGLCLGGRALVAEAGSWRFHWGKGGKDGWFWWEYGEDMGNIWFFFLKSFLEDGFPELLEMELGEMTEIHGDDMFASNCCLET